MHVNRYILPVPSSKCQSYKENLAGSVEKYVWLLSCSPVILTPTANSFKRRLGSYSSKFLQFLKGMSQLSSYRTLLNHFLRHFVPKRIPLSRNGIMWSFITPVIQFYSRRDFVCRSCWHCKGKSVCTYFQFNGICYCTKRPTLSH